MKNENFHKKCRCGSNKKAGWCCGVDAESTKPKYFLNDVLWDDVPEAQPEVVKYYAKAFGMLNDGGVFVDASCSACWQKVGDLNKCFVVLNPDYCATKENMPLVLRSAFHIATAFPGADVLVPFTDEIAATIQTLTGDVAHVRLHFKVVATLA